MGLYYKHVATVDIMWYNNNGTAVSARVGEYSATVLYTGFPDDKRITEEVAVADLVQNILSAKPGCGIVPVRIGDKWLLAVPDLLRVQASTSAPEQGPVAEKRWQPSWGGHFWPSDNYFYVSGAEVLCATYDRTADDELRIAAGNCFRTREEAEAEKAQAPTDEERWKPEVGEDYWTIDSSRNYSRDVVWCADTHDREKFAAGLVFRTKEEAHAALAKLKEQPVTPVDADPWKPCTGENYWTLGDGGVVRWKWVNDKIDVKQYQAGLVFRDQGAAEKMLQSLETTYSWVPYHGDTYYYCGTEGDVVYSDTWANCSFDYRNLVKGNVHKTPGAAHEALERLDK